ncbi:MAG: tRNA pseudouridine(38-40) synthase TruA [Planctomycetota bacterium]
MRNIKLLIQYDGTNYHGWQKQLNVSTIHGAIEEAIKLVTNEEVKITGASRTDSGVHAVGQTANFQTQSNLPVETLSKAINAKLPSDIAIIRAEEADIEFNARFNATGKWYRYLIFSETRKAPLQNRYCSLIKENLDLDKMEKAADLFLGKHDYSAFGAQIQPEDDTICTINSIELNESILLFPVYIGEKHLTTDSKREKLLIIDIHGDRFLYKMVRTICGTLVEVGRGRWEPEHILTVFESKDRHCAGPTLEACGLFLMEVRYK